MNQESGSKRMMKKKERKTEKDRKRKKERERKKEFLLSEDHKSSFSITNARKCSTMKFPNRRWLNSFTLPNCRFFDEDDPELTHSRTHTHVSTHLLPSSSKHTHSLTHTHTHKHTNTHTLTRMHTLALAHSHTHTHTVLEGEK